MDRRTRLMESFYFHGRGLGQMVGLLSVGIGFHSIGCGADSNKDADDAESQVTTTDAPESSSSSGPSTMKPTESESTVGSDESDESGDAGSSSAVTIVQLETGGGRVCVVGEGGELRCWGHNPRDGILGVRGVEEHVGDDELPSSVPAVQLGPAVTEVSMGGGHTCVKVADHQMICWGEDDEGQLGNGIDNNETIGGDDDIAKLGLVTLSDRLVIHQLELGGNHSCARLGLREELRAETSFISVNCWGRTQFGANGVGVGKWDSEHPNVWDVDSGDVDIGLNNEDILKISAFVDRTCSIREGGAVKCWGRGGSAGSLGNQLEDHIGDDEWPSSVPGVELGQPATDIAMGGGHACAILEDGGVRCWGWAKEGQLGSGSLENIGDDEPVVDGHKIVFPLSAERISCGEEHCCALLEDGSIRCWGGNEFGQLGYGHTGNVGDDEVADDLGEVDVGNEVVDIKLGYNFTCVLTVANEVKCWGGNEFGQLGYGHTENIGDDEVPADVGAVSIFP